MMPSKTREPECGGRNARRSAIHFIAFKGDEYVSAVRVFGPPDFVHMGWDRWAKLEIAQGDVAVFARGTFEDEPSPYSFPDIVEARG